MADETISVSAFHYPKNDFVETIATIIDGDGEPVNPRHHRTMQADLVQAFGGDVTSERYVIQSSGELSRFYARRDFSYHITFSKPVTNQGRLGLYVILVAVLSDGSTLNKTVKVIDGSDDATIASTDFSHNDVNATSGIPSEEH